MFSQLSVGSSGGVPTTSGGQRDEKGVCGEVGCGRHPPPPPEREADSPGTDI